MRRGAFACHRRNATVGPINPDLTRCGIPSVLKDRTVCNGPCLSHRQRTSSVPAQHVHHRTSYHPHPPSHAHGDCIEQRYSGVSCERSAQQFQHFLPPSARRPPAVRPSPVARRPSVARPSPAVRSSSVARRPFVVRRPPSVRRPSVASRPFVVRRQPSVRRPSVASRPSVARPSPCASVAPVSAAAISGCCASAAAPHARRSASSSMSMRSARSDRMSSASHLRSI